MAKYLVRYSNKLHNISLAGMTIKERSLFFAICYLLKEKGTNEIALTFEQLKELSKFSSSSIKLFIDTLRSTYKKLIALTFYQETEDRITEFVLFTKYDIDKRKKEVIIKLNEDYIYILNHLDNNYTEHEMLEYSSLKSDYSQLTYALLKKWETTKKVEISLENYRKLLEIPESYSTTNFNKRVLNQVLSELPEYFHGLKIEKLKTGKKVTDLKFTWKYKKTAILDAEVIEVQISEKLNKAIEKAKKNRFIEKLFTDENVEKLLNKFEEDTLIKGLNACYKDIQKDVKSLNYLIKAIETAAGKKTKKIVVEKEKETVQEKTLGTIEEKNLSKPNKIKVLDKEFKEIYKLYLLKNGIVDNKITKKAFSMGYEIVEEIILTEDLQKIVKKYSIDERQILNGLSDGYTREETIKLIESNIIENNRMPEELQKEYEEFLAWKKWNEERMKQK